MRTVGAHERQRTRSAGVVILLLIAAVIAAAAAVLLAVTRKKPVDPHEGQVYIDDGFGMTWMTPIEGLPVSTLKPEEFVTMQGRPIYVGEEYDTMLGIDVSEHQHEIRWNEVAADGIQFAYIRASWRGYTEGRLYEDPYFRYNIKNAAENGIQVGVYAFSQALTVQEAIEEAQFTLKLIEDYDITLPIFFDWERMDEPDSRTLTFDRQTLNDCAVAFCEIIEQAGYEAGVYFNKIFGYRQFDLTRLADHALWYAQPADAPDFYYAFDIWQTSFTGTVRGISTDVDLDIMFIPKEEK